MFTERHCGCTTGDREPTRPNWGGSSSMRRYQSDWAEKDPFNPSFIHNKEIVEDAIIRSERRSEQADLVLRRKIEKLEELESDNNTAINNQLSEIEKSLLNKIDDSKSFVLDRLSEVRAEVSENKVQIADVKDEFSVYEQVNDSAVEALRSQVKLHSEKILNLERDIADASGTQIAELASLKSMVQKYQDATNTRLSTVEDSQANLVSRVAVCESKVSEVDIKFTDHLNDVPTESELDQIWEEI